MVTIVGHRSRFGSIISSSASGGGYDMISGMVSRITLSVSYLVWYGIVLQA